MSLTLKPRVSVRAKISSVGVYVPPRLLTNADLEKMVTTSDEWIVERTGIRQRHVVDKGVATSDLAAVTHFARHWSGIPTPESRRYCARSEMRLRFLSRIGCSQRWIL